MAPLLLLALSCNPCPTPIDPGVLRVRITSPDGTFPVLPDLVVGQGLRPRLAAPPASLVWLVPDATSLTAALRQGDTVIPLTPNQPVRLAPAGFVAVVAQPGIPVADALVDAGEGVQEPSDACLGFDVLAADVMGTPVAP